MVATPKAQWFHLYQEKVHVNLNHTLICHSVDTINKETKNSSKNCYSLTKQGIQNVM